MTLTKIVFAAYLVLIALGLAFCFAMGWLAR